ncbi:unnamed protein product [Miscanthus lutarioriparius]|uniref:Peptidase C14 caspase domain-containing protein n=1 Tax=Miscanthus lutarioriparius TaxID=422564 RepID=A0A811SPK1_9POAL|nr:unnamed protein product [Miscanthus lutarioriparius]
MAMRVFNETQVITKPIYNGGSQAEIDILISLTEARTRGRARASYNATRQLAAAGGKKKMLATLVGCNYAGTPFEMQGCINDVHAMRAVLLDRFGFAPGDVTVLTDDDPKKLPTRDAIKGALDDMSCAANSPTALAAAPTSTDMLACTHARTRRRSVVVTADLYFRELVDCVPAGATFTMVSDSCQSGGLIDQEKEQIGPAAAAADPHLHAGACARRLLPYTVVLSHLSAASGLGASADPLVALLGDDASAKFHANTDDASAMITDDANAEVRGQGGVRAFTRALQAVLAAHPAPMSNREVVRRAREVLSEQRIPQHPCLYCSDANADAPFLGQQDSKAKSN